MAATIKLTTLTAAIAATAITGVNVYDLATTPEQVDVREKAALFPNPVTPVTDIVVENVTHGYNNAAKNLNYKLHYFLAFQHALAGRWFAEYVGDMVEMVATIIETLTTTDFSASGAMGFDVTCPFTGQVTDPAGNAFHGAEIVIDVLEFIQ